jgi:hypothetical protein
MEFHSYLNNQAIRIFPASTDPQNSIGTLQRSPVPLFREFQDRYGFVQIPRSAEDLNLQTGVTFGHGYFKGRIITKFQAYNNGVLCEALDTTDFCDEIIDDVFSWIPKYFLSAGVKIEVVYRAYLSQMQVKLLPKSIVAFDKFQFVGELLNSFRTKYGQTAGARYETLGLKMNIDPSDQTTIKTPDFIFERRTSEPFENGLFFASAPVTTADHWEILRKLEAALGSVG